MKMYRYFLIMLIPTLIGLAACGGSDDNDDSSSNEEASTGATAASAATTTGTTTGDGGNTCLTSNQRTRIVNLFNRAISQSPIVGTAEEFAADEAFDYDDASISVRQQGNNTWIATTRLCIGAECSTQEEVHSVAGACYTIDGFQVRITSSSSSRLAGRYTDTTTQPQASYRFDYNVPANGRTIIRSTTFLNGERYGQFVFREDVPDSPTSSSDASSAASSAASEAASTGGDTDASAAAESAEAATGEVTTGETGATSTTSGISSVMGFGF